MSENILINDILNINSDDIERAKVKLNQWNGRSLPIEEYKTNPDLVNVDWLLWHKQRRYFDTGDIAICLVQIDTDTWLLTTIKEIDELIGIPDTQDGGVGYKAHELHQYEKFYGRLVIKYHKDSRPQVRRYAALKDKLEVLEILNDMYTGDHFPGYDKIRLSYSELERIIRRQLPEWIAALSNQKAVYLITDKFTGKMYVGSATSDNGMLLRRWGDYVANGHGGNQQLVELIKQKGFQYVKDNFVYSVLENYNARVDDSYILGRENWWKETLLTKKFGYNDN